MSDQSIPLVKHVGHVDSLSVATSICLTYTLLIFGLRLYIRNNSYGIDDGFVTFATVSCGWNVSHSPVNGITDIGGL